MLTKQDKDQGDKINTHTHKHTHSHKAPSNKERIICYLLYTNNVEILYPVFDIRFRLHLRITTTKKNCKIYWSLKKIAQAKDVVLSSTPCMCCYIINNKEDHLIVGDGVFILESVLWSNKYPCTTTFKPKRKSDS